MPLGGERMTSGYKGYGLGVMVDWFDPYEHAGATVARITGNLRYHSSATPSWIIRPRRNDDMQLP